MVGCGVLPLIIPEETRPTVSWLWIVILIPPTFTSLVGKSKTEWTGEDSQSLLMLLTLPVF